MSEVEGAPADPIPIPHTNPVQQVALRRDWFSLSSPIGMIGAFTAIVDVALILAAIFIDDRETRTLLILFAAVAFFYVTTWAFHLLKFQPEVLYGPHQYEGGTTALAYAEALNRHRFQAQRAHATTTVDATIVTAARSTDSVAGAIEPPIETKEIKVTQSASVEVLREGEYLTLVVEDEHRTIPYFDPDESAKRGTESKRIRYDPMQWVGMFIVKVSEEYNALGYFATPESYGSSWMMRDRKTGAILSDIGFIQRYGTTVAGVDYRRLSETLVTPGMELEPVELPAPAPFPATDPLPFEEWLVQQMRPDKTRLHRSRTPLAAPGTAPPGYESRTP